MTLTVTDTALKLSPIEVNEDYLKKWNEHSRDFVHLTKNGQVLNNHTLYRVGGMGKPDLNADYFLMLKYTQDLYPDNITKDKNKKRHLKGRWCIINKSGEEKVIFNDYRSPYLVKNSCIYSLNNKYINIETGYVYAQAYSSIETKEFLFLGKYYDSNKGSCLKINKKSGEYEIIE